MSGSDVKAVFITADTQALDADGISVAAAVGNNAALVIGGALASGGACTFDAGRVVTILSAGDDSGISFTVTGTDVNGDSQTESITGANAGTATGAKYFKTLSGISAVGNPAGNASPGVNGAAGEVIFAGRCRMQGLSIVCSATAGTLSFPTTAGMFVQYTVSTFGTMTVFHA